jgi:hypothetical protein
MKASFASRSPTKSRENTKMDGELVPEPGLSTSVLWAGAWAPSCSFVPPSPRAPPANSCHRLPHRPGQLSERACAAVYSAHAAQKLPSRARQETLGL